MPADVFTDPFTDRRQRITVSGPIDVDHGYFEFRVNWGAAALYDMSGEELEQFKTAIRTLERLAGGPF